MGLLDTIIGALGNGGGGGMPPDMMPPDPRDMSINGMPPQAAAPSFPGGVPLPMPRPPEAGPGMTTMPSGLGGDGGLGAGLPDPDANARPPRSVSLLPGGQLDQPAPSMGGPPPVPDSGADIQGLMRAIVGRATNDDPMRRFTSGLAGGLKTINGQPFAGQAFGNALGGSLEGSNKADDSQYEDRLKALDAAIKARSLTEKPTFGIVGEDSFGGKQYGFINAPAGKVTPYTAPQAGGTIGGAVAPAAAAPTIGDDFLSTVPVPMRTLVQKVANYEINPQLLSTKGGHREKIMAAASQYDPNFDAALAPARFAAIKEFNSGGPNAPASTITSGNTAIQHLKTLSDAAQKLGGTGNWGPLNSVINKGNVAIEGAKNNPDLVEYNNALGRFTEEATKFYRGVGGNEADIQRAIEAMTPGQSPEARNRAIATQADLMASKINALQDRWRQATGPAGWKKVTKDFPIVQGKSAEGLDAIMERAGKPKWSQGNAEPDARPTLATSASPAAGPAGQGGLPTVSSPAEAQKLPKGTRFLDPNGIARIVP